MRNFLIGLLIFILLIVSLSKSVAANTSTDVNSGATRRYSIVINEQTLSNESSSLIGDLTC